jgi:hypothetical protein
MATGYRVFSGYVGREVVGMLVSGFGRELAKARMEDLHREAERARALRRARETRETPPRPSVRLAVGMRLVGAGFRLLGEAVER